MYSSLNRAAQLTLYTRAIPKGIGVLGPVVYCTEYVIYSGLVTASGLGIAIQYNTHRFIAYLLSLLFLAQGTRNRIGQAEYGPVVSWLDRTPHLPALSPRSIHFYL